MGEFYINTQTITGQSGRLVEVGSSINGVKARVAGVASGLNSIGLGSMSSVLEAIQTKLMLQVNTTDTLSSTLSNIVLKYIAAESEIMGIPFYLNPDYIAAFMTTAENSMAIMQNEQEALTGYYSGVYYEFGEVGGYTWGAVASWKNDDGVAYTGSCGLLYTDSDFSVGPSVDLMDDYHQNERYLDDDMHNDYVNDFENRRPETVHLIELDATLSESLFHGDISAESAYASGEASFDFLKYEAEATVWGGLWDKDGNFAPGFGAELGASFSVFSANAEGRLGTDYLGVYGEAGVEVGKVSAEVAATFGLVDADGKWNPSVGLEASLEAVAAQASGSAGVRVMGTDIGVTGSVGVGIGAHANVGIIDGKLSVDIGAYLGVGASASFEIDFSDTYDTMVSAYNEVTEFVSDGWNDFTDAVSDGWDSFTDGVSDVWDAATSWWPW